MLTREEKDCLYRLAQAWNLLVKMPREHPNELNEFKDAIHRAEQIIGMRVARRVEPDIFSLLNRSE